MNSNKGELLDSWIAEIHYLFIFIYLFKSLFTVGITSWNF